jgi:dimethylargininase
MILTRLPSPNMANAELTYLARSPIDFGLLQTQHQNYRAALSALDTDLKALPALIDYPDSAFVEDVSICLPELSIVCSPGALSRHGEVAEILNHLPVGKPIVRIELPATLDGGDVLVVEKTIFIGLSTRTNRLGVEQIKKLGERLGYKVVPVKVRGALHLKTAVTAVASDLLIFNPEWIDGAVFEDWQTIVVDPNEPFSGNCLRVKDHVFVQSNHQEAAEQISLNGLCVQLIDISEFAKAEAGLTCLSVLVD